MIPLYGHLACSDKGDFQWHTERSPCTACVCVGDRREESARGKVLRKNLSSSCACLEKVGNESHSARGKHRNSILARTGGERKCWAKNAMESEQPTSERRALIKAAGKRLEGKSKNRYDFFLLFWLLRASARWSSFKNLLRTEGTTLNSEIGLSESRGKFCEKCFFEAGLAGVREKIFHRCTFVRTKHFLIGGRSFVHKTIHLPVRRSEQPIKTQQERKHFSHVGFTHLFRP